MKREYFRPRLQMILAVSVCTSLLIPSIDSFGFGTYAHQLRSKYRLGLDQYRDAIRPESKSTTENVRIQRKRSNGAPTSHYVGVRGVDGGFLTFKEAPAKLVEAREHGQATLQCSAAGSPAPSLTWYKDGAPVIKVPKIVFYPGHESNEISAISKEEAEKSLGVATAKLELECITEEDAGFYQCVASQGDKVDTVGTEVHVVSYGAGNCNPKSLTTSPPKISQFYQTFMMEMGYDAHLKCVTVGRHSTTWLGPDEQPIVDSGKFKVMPDGSLVIHNLDFNDMGVYQCVAKNKFGHDMAETFVYPVAVS